MSLVGLLAELASCDSSSVGGKAHLIADLLRIESNRSALDGRVVIQVIHKRFEEDPTAFARLLANVLVDNNTHRQLTIDCGIPEQLLRHLNETPSKLNLTILVALLNLTTDYAPAQSHLTHIIPQLTVVLKSAFSNPESEFAPSILDFAFDTLANLLHVAPLPASAHKSLLHILDHFLTSHHRPEFVQQLSVILQEAALKSPQLKRCFVERSGLLERSMDFLERYEAEDAEDEGDIAILKSNLIKIIVDLPNEDSLLPLLLAESTAARTNDAKSDNVVSRMVDWISRCAGGGRADLVICAAHYLAALARTDANSILLVDAYGVLPPVCELLKNQIDQYFVPVPPTPSTIAAVENSATSQTRNDTASTSSKRSDKGEVIQLLYGVVNLLRHLAIPRVNKISLGDANLFEPLSRLLGTSLDFVGPLQVSVVGLIKLIVVDGVGPSIDFTLGSETVSASASTPSSTPLDIMIALINRTDEIRIQAEGTRVIINTIKSLFKSSPSTSSPSPGISERLDVAQASVRRVEVMELLVRLIRTQEKFPVLVNEAVAGLILLLATSAKERSGVMDVKEIDVGEIVDLLLFAPPVTVAVVEDSELAQEAKLLEITDDEPIIDATNSGNGVDGGSGVAGGTIGGTDDVSKGGSAMDVFIRWLESLAASYASTKPFTPLSAACTTGLLETPTKPPPPKIEKEMVKNLLVLLLTLVNRLHQQSPSPADSAWRKMGSTAPLPRRQKLLNLLLSPLGGIVVKVPEREETEDVREYARQILEVLQTMK